ncbi:MAG TPA: hypothetical protein PKD72_11595 [Gemmatales bacterium]|nr:hypothetical protein [Gemmatales bacterium]
MYWIALLSILTSAPDDALFSGPLPYTVDQPPPPPLLSEDDQLVDSRQGFNVILGTALSLNSDTAFPRFIGPSSNPWLAKDPRSLTEARLLGVLNWTPAEHAWDSNLSQMYLLQGRLALNKQWSVFLDKFGYSFLDRGSSGTVDGWNNLGIGTKYVLIRDVENQFLLSAALQYEAPTGEASVYQRPSDGSITSILTAGKELFCFWHVLGNLGVRAPLSNESSTLLFSQLHLDYEIAGWLHPLVELNYYRILSEGRGVYPSSFGQGDAFLDWSVPGTLNSDLVTIAAGFRAKCNRSMEFGVTYERPLSETPRLIEHRVIAELILRY